MPPRDAFATPRGHRCEATCSACVFPDLGQGPPNRVPRDLTTLLPPRPLLCHPPHKAEATLTRYPNNKKKINASQPADRFTLTTQRGALPLAQDLPWSSCPYPQPSTHLNCHQPTGIVARKDVYLKTFDAQVASQNLPARARERGCGFLFRRCSNIRPMVRHRERISVFAYQACIG